MKDRRIIRGVGLAVAAIVLLNLLFVAWVSALFTNDMFVKNSDVTVSINGVVDRTAEVFEDKARFVVLCRGALYEVYKDKRMAADGYSRRFLRYFNPVWYPNRSAWGKFGSAKREFSPDVTRKDGEISFRISDDKGSILAISGLKDGAQ